MREFLEKSANELIKELGDMPYFPKWIIGILSEKLALRDADILAHIEIDNNIEGADTLPPEKEEKTNIDNTM